MERPDFVHLHLHSEYSLSDGIIRISELVSRASSLKYSAVGLTDLTNLFGLLEFYRSSRENGIKPIVGNQIFISPGRICKHRHLDLILLKGCVPKSNVINVSMKMMLGSIAMNAYLDPIESSRRLIKGTIKITI